MAGAPVAAVPTGATNTSNDVPAVGAGVHWNAQPMFQLAAVMVKVGLVQLPCDCVGPRSSRAGELATVEVVAVEEVVDELVVDLVELVVDDPVGLVVVLEPPPPLTAVLVVLDPPAGGRA
jgi:hypothetical protein